LATVRRRWTSGEEKQLSEMLDTGMTAIEISLQLNRTLGAIYEKLQRANSSRDRDITVS